MKKYAFIIDVGKCENCNNCFLACKDEHCGNEWPGYSLSQPLHGQRWMDIKQKERGEFPLVDVAYLPRPCMHCDDAPCVSAGKGMITKREDGIVLIDPVAARGHVELKGICPHGALWWNEGEEVVQKCTMCAHLLDQGWKVPRCVQACPTGALSFFTGSDEELQAKVTAEHLQSLTENDNGAGRSRCYYRNLYRYTRNFVAGTLVRTVNGVEECAAGVGIVLRQGTEVVAEEVSDDFGDFRFDNLQAGQKEYTIELSGFGGDTLGRSFSISATMTLGVLKIA